MKSSTATGTTATASARTAAYRGRFAPSPNGPLHRGSLLAAVASWLDARARGGAWIIRMEDLDGPRVVAGAADEILATLARFGLTPDEAVLYQSGRAAAYRAALESLAARGLAYRCRCARSEVQGPYDGRCRDLGITDEDCAWRLRLDANATLAFEDRIQGHVEYRVADLGDPVLMRRDGIAAYQLAVVVDDAFQRITDVVRGADLLESTAWQIALARALDVPVPAWAHVPLLTEPDGSKLAKSRHSLSIAELEPAPALVATIAVLGLHAPAELKAAPVSDILQWAVQHWSLRAVAGVRAVPLRDGSQLA
ncbi:MAG TPA: tRNA glutamyl-Q(34) synthetase GluQRS [Steroidobacteraceae bacterium]|nr:tRNA glutamyl-Q(34) synthetase GluQRS [Steroidobacteraceae bacterium]